LVICLKLGYTPNSHFDRDNQWTSWPCGLGDILFPDKATRKMVASHHVWTCLDHVLSKALNLCWFIVETYTIWCGKPNKPLSH
jgi:hypothetical protein